MPAELLGHVFKRAELLAQALTHATFAHEQKPVYGSYERLEFLGDAVLQLLVSEYLYAAMPLADEGALSRRRAQLVREATLAHVAHHLHLAPLIKVGVSQQGAPLPASILADVVEALLAAVYLDGGLAVVRTCFAPLLAQALTESVNQGDAKTQLQELCHQRMWPAPLYRVTQQTGPDHARQYHVTLTLSGDVITHGLGASKKSAEQLCARRALVALGLSQQS